MFTNLKPIIYQSKTNPTGPIVAMTCMNHGDEVIGLNTALALVDFLKQYDSNFCGKIVIFSCMNQAGFWRGSRYFEGQNFDGNSIPNLNRTWPGDEKSYSGLLAKDIFSQILNLDPDLVLDLHSYSQNSLVHNILDRPGGQLEEDLINLAKSSLMPYYLEYPAKTLEDQKLDKALSNQLCLLGIKSITTELGPKGSFSTKQQNIALQALINILIANQNLIVDSNLIQIKDLFKVQDTTLDQDKTYYREGIYAGNNTFGFFRNLADIGHLITKGEPIFEIFNLEGDVVETILMPENGYLISFEDEAVVYPKRQIAVYIKKL